MKIGQGWSKLLPLVLITWLYHWDDNDGYTMFIETCDEFGMILRWNKREHSPDATLIDKSGESVTIGKFLGAGIENDGSVFGVSHKTMSPFKQVGEISAYHQRADIHGDSYESRTPRRDVIPATGAKEDSEVSEGWVLLGSPEVNGKY